MMVYFEVPAVADALEQWCEANGKEMSRTINHAAAAFLGDSRRQGGNPLPGTVQKRSRGLVGRPKSS